MPVLAGRLVIHFVNKPFELIDIPRFLGKTSSVRLRIKIYRSVALKSSICFLKFNSVFVRKWQENDPIANQTDQYVSFFFRRDISILSSRVGVSENFSGDQLCFRIFSRLFQLCSLPENLITAIYQLWTALKTKVFSAENQRWRSLLFQCWFFWSSSDSELNSAHFWRFQNENCLLNFQVFWNFSLRKVRKEIKNKNLLVKSSYSPII